MDKIAVNKQACAESIPRVIALENQREITHVVDFALRFDKSRLKVSRNDEYRNTVKKIVSLLAGAGITVKMGMDILDDCKIVLENTVLNDHFKYYG